MLSKEAISQITDAIWERLAGDVATGRGMLKSSVHEALAGWNATNEPEMPTATELGIDPKFAYRIEHREWDQLKPGGITVSGVEEVRRQCAPESGVETYADFIRRMNACGWRI